MVEVFKTNIEEQVQARRMLDVLKESCPTCRLNFDLEDCDRILRVEGKAIQAQKIIQVFRDEGYQCRILD